MRMIWTERSRVDERMTRGRAGRDARVRRWAAAVLDNENHPAQNTFPSWSRSSDFERRPMPTISERYFRFYKQTKQGRVR